MEGWFDAVDSLFVVLPPKMPVFPVKRLPLLSEEKRLNVGS
jgi:hypothetical protein